MAGGATCAARLRRLDEGADIVVLDRGPYVSFANCRLPYYVGDVIKEESKLLVATPGLFCERFNIEVRTLNEITAINRESREVHVRDLRLGRIYRESYDAFVLSPGAAPICPPLPGIDLPGIFSLRTIPDSRQIREWIEERSPRRPVAVGGAFIGLEMAEHLVHRGLEVTIVEMANQLMPPLDPEMAEFVRRRLATHTAHLQLGHGVAGFEHAADGSLIVHTQKGETFPADIVILSIGVRPESDLAREAGLEVGARGGIRVNDQMRTSDPHIWAVGDAVEVENTIGGQWELIPLAGPANRQGRVAADVICGRDLRFRGVQATAVCGFFGLTVALTGVTEKSLRRAGVTDFEAVSLHPGHHVGCYPGAKPIHLKLLFRKSDGLVLGAQAIGEEGVERRIDVIATAMQMSASVFDLEEAELCSSLAPRGSDAGLRDMTEPGHSVSLNSVAQEESVTMSLATGTEESKRLLHARPQPACFVCGQDNPNGLRIRYELQESGEITATWTPAPAWEGFRGIVHGGVVSTVLDEAMSKAVAATGCEALTAELRVRFRRHVTSGDAFLIRGWISNRNKRLIEAEAVLTALDGTEHAHAWAAFLALPKASA